DLAHGRQWQSFRRIGSSDRSIVAVYTRLQYSPIASFAVGNLRMIPVLVINLPRDGERRSAMDSHLRSLGIPHAFVSAINGRELPDEGVAPHRQSFRRGHGREPTLGEIGCALSHLHLFRLIADGDHEFVCTMEDDIELSPAALPLLDEATLRSLPP